MAPRARGPFRLVSGVSLVELLVALGAAAILALVAMPGAGRLLDDRRASTAINGMLGAIQLARASAVTYRMPAALCPDGGARCGARNDWHEGVLVFLDADASGSREPDERILARLPPLPEGHRIYWRSFRSRTALVFRASGHTDWQNGSMLYCPPRGEAGLARLLIVNAQGRARGAEDGDGDGVVEDAAGDPVSCPG